MGAGEKDGPDEPADHDEDEQVEEGSGRGHQSALSLMDWLILYTITLSINFSNPFSNPDDAVPTESLLNVTKTSDARAIEQDRIAVCAQGIRTAFRMKTFFTALLAALILHTTAAHAQVLVYRISFSDAHGINYESFNGGYFAAPLLGGAGTFLLTSNDGARILTQSDGGGRLFTAVSGGEKKSVIAAQTGGGTAGGAMVALGDINHTLQVQSPIATISIRVAKILTGTAVSADDESTTTDAPTDGSLGSAGFSQVHFTLDEAQTKAANQAGKSLSQALEQLKLQLEREGYSAPAPVATPVVTIPTGQ